LSASALAAIGPGTGRAETPAFDSGGTGNLSRQLVESYRAVRHGRYSEAIDIDTKAIAIAPSYGDAYWVRASTYMNAGRFAEAQADYDHVIKLRPGDFSPVLDLAQLLLVKGDAAASLAKIKVVVQMPVYTFHHEGAGQGAYGATGHALSYIYAVSSVAEQVLHQDDAALGDMSRMLDTEKDHPEYLLSFYCWNAAVVGLLDSAEMTCQRAIEVNSHDIGQYDTLGYVHLRMKQWDKAIADYNKALDGRSDLTTSLYGRGVARRARGDIAGGNADIAAAVKGEPDIANIMQRLHAPAP
jgi:Flp pilus assembly protein TadD